MRQFPLFLILNIICCASQGGEIDPKFVDTPPPKGCSIQDVLNRPAPRLFPSAFLQGLDQERVGYRFFKFGNGALTKVGVWYHDKFVDSFLIGGDGSVTIRRSNLTEDLDLFSHLVAAAWSYRHKNHLVIRSEFPSPSQRQFWKRLEDLGLAEHRIDEETRQSEWSFRETALASSQFDSISNFLDSHSIPVNSETEINHSLYYKAELTAEERTALIELYSDNKLRQALLLYLRPDLAFELKREFMLRVNKTPAELDGYAAVWDRILAKSQSKEKMTLYRGEEFRPDRPLPVVGDKLDFFQFPNFSSDVALAAHYAEVDPFSPVLGYGRRSGNRSVFFELEWEARQKVFLLRDYLEELGLDLKSIKAGVHPAEVVLPRNLQFEISKKKEPGYIATGGFTGHSFPTHYYFLRLSPKK